MRLGLTLSILLSISVFAQNFFPIKTGDKIQYRLFENGSVSGGFSRESFNKSIITETEYQGKTYVNFINGLFRYDSLNQKMYRLIGNIEKLAYDFNKSAGETDTLFIDGFSNVWTYSETVYSVFGQERIIKSIFRQYAQYQDTQEWKYVFAEGLGLYNKYYYHEYAYAYIQSSETMISAIIDNSVYNPLTLSVTAILPDCISAVNNIFNIGCNIYSEYAGLVDTLKAEVNIVSDDSVLYAGVFYRSGESGPIPVNLPSALLVPPNSVNIKVICQDKSIFENTAQYPDSGFVNISCQSNCGELWSVISAPDNWQYPPFLTMKFFNKDRGRIVMVNVQGPSLV